MDKSKKEQKNVKEQLVEDTKEVRDMIFRDVPFIKHIK